MALSIVVAPDSFKGSLTAVEATRAITAGWLSVRPDDSVLQAPQADGGEGTLDTIEAAVPAAVRHSVGPVTGPDYRPTPGEWLELPGGIAVVELAQCAGLPLMQQLDARGATSRGVGEVIRAALATGARSLVIALGGSASTDGGIGALRALGLEVTGADGRPIGDGGAALASATGYSTSGMLPPPLGGVTLLTDVTAPLLGPHGAAAIFGPQKGAGPDDIVELEAALAHFAALLGTGGRTPGADPSTPGSGAAGGTAWGFRALWHASIEPGAASIAALTGLDRAIQTADVVLLGEGRFDEQSLTGKVVSHALGVAESSGTTPGIIAGQLGITPTNSVGDSIWATELASLAGSADAAIADPVRWLTEAGARAARALGGGS